MLRCAPETDLRMMCTEESYWRGVTGEPLLYGREECCTVRPWPTLSRLEKVIDSTHVHTALGDKITQHVGDRVWE